jgi:hypothetical protein
MRESTITACSVGPSPLPASLLENRDRFALVRTLREATLQRNEMLLRAVFERLEVLLRSRDRNLRRSVTEFLEALQDSVGWGFAEADACLALMGPGARSIWSALHAIRSDLAECSVLEAEVGMWRVVHHGQ